jgi:hypothetical protein
MTLCSEEIYDSRWMRPAAEDTRNSPASSIETYRMSEAGMDHHLVKPVTLEDIQQIVADRPASTS